MTASVSEKCGSCGRPSSARMRHCSTCGWSNEQKQRCCLKCEGPVVLNNGMNSAAGGGGGLLGAVMAWFFGLALSLTLLFGVAFALTLAGVFTMGFKCNMCGWTAADNLLSKQEKEEKGGKRFKMILGSAACGVLAVACFAWWAWAMKSRLNGS
jgi:hypothetical protein